MTDLEVRLATLRLAVETAGFVDKIKLAREYYGWVTDGAEETPVLSIREAVVEITPEGTQILKPAKRQVIK